MSDMNEVDANASVAETTPQVDAGGDTTEKDQIESQDKPAPESTTKSTQIIKTTASADRNPRKNNKFDPSGLPASTDGDEIRRQVEFYFSDSNLDNGDAFFMERCGGSENKPVSIETIASFKRMRHFRPVTVIVEALRESKELEVVGEAGQEGVKRKVAWKPSPQSLIDARSIYAKGFGDETPSTQFDIESFFKPYGPIGQVRLRRTVNQLFKGSVFVEFKEVESYEKFLALETKPQWAGVHELLIRPKTEYLKEKNISIVNGETELSRSHNRGGQRGGNRGQRGGRGRGGRDRGDRDPDDWKKRRSDDQANGFKDRGGGKQGRGRGRGGQRDGDGNHERRQRNSNNDNDKDEATSKSDEPATASTDASTTKTNGGEAAAPTIADSAAPVSNDKKRERDDDGTADEQPAKKVDTKTDAL